MSSEEEIISICKEGIFYYNPQDWNEENSKNIDSLIAKGIIEPCSAQQPGFMNSSYCFTLKNTRVEVKTTGCYSWLEKAGTPRVRIL